MIKISFKNLLENRQRTTLSIIGLSVAVMGFIVLVSISAGIREHITSSLSSIQGITVFEKDTFNPLSSIISSNLESKIKRVPGVYAVTPEVFHMVSTGEGMKGYVILGIDPEKSRKLRNGGIIYQHMVKGRYLRENDKTNVIVTKDYAEKYDVNVGSRIKIGNHSYKVVGISDIRLGPFSEIVIMHIDEARRLKGIGKDKVSIFYADVDNPKQASLVSKRIEMMIPNVEARSSSEFTKELSSVFSSLDLFFIAISFIALFVGAISILNTMLMSVLERTKEFGILRAVGWRKRDVLFMIIMESLILGFFSGIFGILLSLAIITLINNFLTFKAVYSSFLFSIGFLLSIILSLIGGIYPAYRASKLDPVEAIRYG